MWALQIIHIDDTYKNSEVHHHKIHVYKQKQSALSHLQDTIIVSLEELYNENEDDDECCFKQWVKNYCDVVTVHDMDYDPFELKLKSSLVFTEKLAREMQRYFFDGEYVSYTMDWVLNEVELEE